MKKAKQKKHIDKTGRRISLFGFFVSFFGTLYVLLGVLIPVKLAVQPMSAAKSLIRRQESHGGLLVLLAGRDELNRAAFLLVNLNAEQKSITVAALPGETVVAGGGNETLKKIFLSRGILAVRQELLRQEIAVDRCALFSPEGTAELINRLGGLTFNLEEEHAALLGNPTSEQTLPGDEGVLVFSRPPEMDRARQINGQARVVASMIGSALAAGGQDNALGYFQLCVNICDTDINIADFHRWIPVLAEIAGQPAVTIAVAGEYIERDGESFFEIDEGGWDKLRESFE